MDPASRNRILKMKDYLSKRIDIIKLKPVLEQHKIFTNAMLDDIYNYPSDYDFYVELTTRGPNAFCEFRNVLKNAGYSLESKILETDSPYELSQIISRKQLCYKMNSKPFVGRCFIINNVLFERLQDRHGSDKDAEDLKNLFSKLGYEVKLVRNLNGDEMESYLEKCSKEEWSNVDSCVIFILSHGDNMGNLDIIYGVDSVCVKKRDIYKLFDNVNCEPLKYKPKIFFFQACRGDDEDDGVYEAIESTDAAKVVKIPSMSNMLAVHSSLPNHISYRDHIDGTWFCQDLVEVFASDYLTQDLETMLKTVARKVETRVSVKQKKQVLSTENFGFKAAVYFNMDNVADFCEIYDPKSS